ncbi:MAG: hypothetical protein CM1200mP39_30980 [Dehalococcoidia bacterium]|nr:MAG: hypothetical protein CM1200mP39_30980 [Dehalococcoidia bacterium]
MGHRIKKGKVMNKVGLSISAIPLSNRNGSGKMQGLEISGISI